MNVLLQLITYQFTVLLSYLLLLQQLPLQLAKVVELLLLLLMLFTFLIICNLGRYKLLFELILQPLCFSPLLDGFLKLPLVLNGVLSQGVHLIGYFNQLCS